MAQSDYVISDQDGASFLVDINGHLQAIATINSGATEPTTTYAYQLWADTGSGVLKQRNAANNGWINKGNLADVDWGLLNKAGGTMSGLLNLAAGADIASASTVDLTAATGNCPKITGTTAVTAWTMNTGQQMKCIADGALPLTYHATTNNIEGGADYTCAAGDIINLVKGLDGVIRVRIEKQDGTPVVSASTGRVVAQIQTFQTGAVATGTTIIPLDDTIPQNTEGTQFMTLAITPINVGSTLEIDVAIKLTNPAAGAYHLIAALFKDSDSSAIAVANTMFDASGSNNTNMITFKHIMTAGTTSEVTFKVRGGMSFPGTYTFNGAGGVRQFGGAVASRITIKEYLP